MNKKVILGFIFMSSLFCFVKASEKQVIENGAYFLAYVEGTCKVNLSCDVGKAFYQAVNAVLMYGLDQSEENQPYAQPTIEKTINTSMVLVVYAGLNYGAYYAAQRGRHWLENKYALSDINEYNNSVAFAYKMGLGASLCNNAFVSFKSIVSGAADILNKR